MSHGHVTNLSHVTNLRRIREINESCASQGSNEESMRSMSHVHFTNSMSHVHVTNSMQTIYVGDQRVMYGSTIQWRIYETNESCICHELNADNVVGYQRVICHSRVSDYQKNLSRTQWGIWVMKIHKVNEKHTRSTSHLSVTHDYHRNLSRTQRGILEINKWCTCYELSEDCRKSMSHVYAPGREKCLL